jgi:hypothetical protein
VIGIQWLVSTPAEVLSNASPPIVAEALLRSAINLTDINDDNVTRCVKATTTGSDRRSLWFARA